MNWRRRVRGAIGMGIIWGLAWLAAGLVLLAIVGLDAADVPFPLFFGFLGFWAGVVFSAIFGSVERGRNVEQMTVPRFAGWGAVGGVVLALLVVAIATLGGDSGAQLLVLAPVFGVAGAASAAGSLALARKGAQRNLLHPGMDTTDFGLHDSDSHEPIGDGR